MDRKRIKLELVGLNGNIFCLMGAFKKQARKEKWTDQEIDAVFAEAKKGDYDHAVATLYEHTK